MFTNGLLSIINPSIISGYRAHDLRMLFWDYTHYAVWRAPGWALRNLASSTLELLLLKKRKSKFLNMLCQALIDQTQSDWPAPLLAPLSPVNSPIFSFLPLGLPPQCPSLQVRCLSSAFPQHSCPHRACLQHDWHMPCIWRGLEYTVVSRRDTALLQRTHVASLLV